MRLTCTDTDPDQPGEMVPLDAFQCAALSPNVPLDACPSHMLPAWSAWDVALARRPPALPPQEKQAGSAGLTIQKAHRPSTSIHGTYLTLLLAESVASAWLRLNWVLPDCRSTFQTSHLTVCVCALDFFLPFPLSGPLTGPHWTHHTHTTSDGRAPDSQTPRGACPAAFRLLLWLPPWLPSPAQPVPAPLGNTHGGMHWAPPGFAPPSSGNGLQHPASKLHRNKPDFT